MGQAAELAAQHPDVKFVVDHIGCPYRRDDEGYADWLKNMKVRRAAGAAHVAVSGRTLNSSATFLP
jgi:predicted TIM-barrel fold metal-dependent hydrolase